MTRNMVMIIIMLFSACQPMEKPVLAMGIPRNTGSFFSTIADLPLPAGYVRINGADSSFAHWLRQVPLKKNTTVYLYNGEPKRNQQAQFAVLDVPVGNKDLQQCADAVMRLRAEYLYRQHRFSAICFADNNGKKYTCPAQADRPRFERYLEQVFSYCGTLSLEKQLKPVGDFANIQPGDVLIKGGSPGHAVMVMDVAANKQGKKIYLLAQSYMPAQDIHVLKNPENGELSPWYEVNDNPLIITPEWRFSTSQLRRW